MILELTLLITMIGLSVVLIFEMREYRKVQKLSGQLELLVATYTAAFNSVTNAITSLETKYVRTAEEHMELENEMTVMRTILDVHNKALNLNPNLVEMKPPNLD